MDVGGQDATDAFEDVGHSDEAREILNGLLVGKLKRQVYLSIYLPHLSPLLLTLLSPIFPIDFVSSAILCGSGRKRLFSPRKSRFHPPKYRAAAR